MVPCYAPNTWPGKNWTLELESQLVTPRRRDSSPISLKSGRLVEQVSCVAFFADRRQSSLLSIWICSKCAFCATAEKVNLMAIHLKMLPIFIEHFSGHSPGCRQCGEYTQCACFIGPCACRLDAPMKSTPCNNTAFYSWNSLMVGFVRFTGHRVNKRSMSSEKLALSFCQDCQRSNLKRSKLVCVSEHSRATFNERSGLTFTGHIHG